MQEIRIGGRTFEMAFTLDALAALEALDKDFDLTRITGYAQSPKGLGDLIFAMVQQGEYLAGRKLDVDRAWIGAHLSPAPKAILDMRIKVLNCIGEGMAMEAEQDEEGEVDVTLAEIKKKETKGA